MELTSSNDKPTLATAVEKPCIKPLPRRRQCNEKQESGRWGGKWSITGLAYWQARKFRLLRIRNSVVNGSAGGVCSLLKLVHWINGRILPGILVSHLPALWR